MTPWIPRHLISLPASPRSSCAHPHLYLGFECLILLVLLTAHGTWESGQVYAYLFVTQVRSRPPLTSTLQIFEFGGSALILPGQYPLTGPPAHLCSGCS